MGEIADGLLAADDGAVRVALGQELIRLHAAEPAAALGIAPGATAAELRARFLALVKVYHPNRFARRPPDIVRLANEVFLHLRRAHQQLGEPPGANQPGRRSPSPTSAGGMTAISARASEVSPATQPRLDVDAALAARRRRARSHPLVPGSGTSAPPSHMGSEALEKTRRLDEQRQRYDTALCDLRLGRLPSARAILRLLVAEAPSSRHYRAHLHYVTGRIHESAGRTSEAVLEYERALGFDPELEAARASRESLSPPPDGADKFSRRFRK